MNIIKEISTWMISTLKIFFGSDTDIMSNQVKNILANPVDKEKYLKALGNLRKLREEGKQGIEKILLSTGEELELTT